MEYIPESVGGRSHQRWLLISVMAVLALLAATCGLDKPTAAATNEPTAEPGPSATTEPTPAKAEWEIEWEETLAAAKEEGTLVVALSGGSFRQFRPVVEHFGKKFGIQVEISQADDDRLLAERSNGRYEIDIRTTSRDNALTRLVPAGVFDPLDEMLFLPDVVDESLWYGGRHVYVDAERKYVFTFSARSLYTPVEVQFNTDHISPDDLAKISSAWDFVDPKRFKGQIVSAYPPDNTGFLTLELAHPDLGEDWIRALFAPELDVLFLTDARPITDAVGKGSRPIAIGIGGFARQVDRLARQGANIKRWSQVLTKPTKEKLYLRAIAASNNIGVANRAPNPNAAKLFINWWLSKEGQTARHAYAASLTDPTLREDIDVTQYKMTLLPARRAGVDYIPSDDPILTADIPQKETRLVEIWREIRK